MIAVPFIYFSILSLVLYFRRGKRIDFSVIISTIFAISGLFSILVDAFGLRNSDTENYSISFLASFSYCALITVCLLPFVRYSNLTITTIRPLRKSALLKMFAVLSILWFLTMVYFSLDTFIIMLTSNMGEARIRVYAGDVESSLNNIPAVMRPIMILFNSIFKCSWVLIFLAFFSRFVQRLPVIYFWLYFLSSLSGPYNSVIGADRSAVAYWVLTALGVYHLFIPVINKKEKRSLVKGGVIIIFLLGVYLIMMTISRFSESGLFGGDDSATQGSLIYYFGISYINFCNFFDNYTPPFSDFGILFPFTTQFILGIKTGATLIQERMTLATGFECGTFYTFIGQIIMGAGKFVAIVFCFLYSFFSFIVLPSTTNRSGARIHDLYMYFMLVTVLYLGLFVYYYTSPYITFSVFFFYFLLRLSK